MFLICGLGNPGSEYLKTRHNIGFLFIDFLLSKLDIAEEDLKNKYSAKFIKTEAFGEEVVFLKPQTYMNNSGTAVHEISHFYKIIPKRTIIIHDELDLKYGDLRVKFAGGHAGHNGLKSIDKCITKKYHRIRLGIDHPKNSKTPLMPVSDYVLSNIPLEEYEMLGNIFSKAENYLKDIFLQESKTRES